MKYFLDTNVFLRVLVVENKKAHKECLKLLDNVRLGLIEAVTGGVVLMEIGWVLKSIYKLTSKEVAKKISGVLNLNGLEIVDGYEWKSALTYLKSKNVKLADALIAGIPEVSDNKWTVVSYDTDFKKLPVKWMKPGEVVEHI